MSNCKCDYCGHHEYRYTAGDACPKCRRGVMCERGSRGFPKISMVRRMP